MTSIPTRPVVHVPVLAWGKRKEIGQQVLDTIAKMRQVAKLIAFWESEPCLASPARHQLMRFSTFLAEMYKVEFSLLDQSPHIEPGPLEATDLMK